MIIQVHPRERGARRATHRHLTKAHELVAIASHETEICRLPAKGYGTAEFDMSDDRLEALIRAGCQAMKDYLGR